MKKLITIFKKPKKTKERLCRDAVPDYQDNIQPVNISSVSVYNSLKFETGLENQGNPDFSLGPRCDNDIENTLAQVENIIDSQENIEDFDSGSDCSTAIYGSDPGKNTRTEVVEVPKTSLKPEKAKEASKPKNNTYVIRINNSKYFHIGSQKTINLSDCAKDGVRQNKLTKNWSYNSVQQVEDDSEVLINCEEKLTEDHIKLISIYLDDKWKDIGKDLGLEESLLEDIELRNDNDRTLSVYDILQMYVEQFPNTTLGFVASILKENCQTNVIHKLSQKIKT